MSQPQAVQQETPSSVAVQRSAPPSIEEELDASKQEMEQGQLSWKQAMELLDTIPGINQRVAEGILAEIGIDMSRFPSAKHGPACAQATTRVRASATQARHGKDAPTYENC